ncbi:Choline/Carnitine o-acyltransferase-domain-containing protein [Xylaria sp. CBS 124048]|nr:Choline/Carnitine o-acyltransferase-domain-containing protein [Xylaria sp. CBS 124048]
MSTQVRIFAMPKSLGETLAAGSPSSLPIKPVGQLANSDVPNLRQLNYKPNTMAIHEEPTDGITYAAQDGLPKLPIPDLESSCQKYLAALKPLQGPREHADTRLAVQDFLRSSGPHLQEKLQQYALGKSSFIEQFWYDSYLNFDNPVVLNLNPFFLLEDDPTPARNHQVTRSASLVVSALQFVRAVRREELPPDNVKGRPLCMYQYSRLFGTARVPTDHGCQIEQDPYSKHIVVLCHGQFYWFDVLDDNSDLIMSERDVCINLQTIIDDAVQTPIQEAAKGALGILSTENRKIWSGLRDVLTREAGSNNADCLGIVDSALFVLCLDYTEPTTAAALCQNMLCGTNEVVKGVQIGTCINRWYDKLQIIVCKNGSAGINFEHTGVDGHTVLRFASDVYTDTILRFARSINGQAPSLWKTTSPDPSKRDPDSFGDVNTTPHKLEWDMTPELNVAVRFAETRLADLISQNEFECLDFGGYGKSFITSMGFSPDAFVQMAFQAAYYGLYGRVECAYEPAMTKSYLHGRTEAIRSVSEESVNFVQTFWSDNPAEAKVEALRKACEHHVKITRACAKGEGCDRHLYALFCVWQRYNMDDDSSSSRAPSSMSFSSPIDSGSAGDSIVGSPGKDSVMNATEMELHTRQRCDSMASNLRSRSDVSPVPAIFADAGWDRLNTTILSTSNCGNPSLRQFGFGPTSGDGFGIGYIIKDEGINICVSSRHRQTKRFIDTLESYLLEIRRVLRVTGRKAAPAKQTRAREVDPSKTKASNRLKARGRKITGLDANSMRLRLLNGSSTGTRSPTEESIAISEDDELGGYGFFDAGMLLQALKARGEAYDHDECKAERVNARRRDVGKKLRLAEY